MEVAKELIWFGASAVEGVTASLDHHQADHQAKSIAQANPSEGRSKFNRSQKSADWICQTQQNKRASYRYRRGHQAKGFADGRQEFDGYRDFVVQDTIMECSNTRYRRAVYRLPDGKLIVGQRPDGVDSHFGPALIEFILLQTHREAWNEQLTDGISRAKLIAAKSAKPPYMVSC